jgi:hypothetical protein
MKRTPRQPSKVCESLHRQLNSYALAASAAGVGLLALGQSADAKVVYTPAHKWLPVNKNLYLDLNHDGVNDFQLLLASSTRTSGFTRALSVRWTTKTQPQNQVYSVLSGGVLCAAALPEGKRVGPSRGFNNRLNAAGMFRVFSNPDCTSHSTYGPWLDVKGRAYLGVRFAIKGKVHYGWARIGHISPNKPVKVLLTGYAYETIPNKAIITGKTKGQDVIMFQPDTLGELARGRK